MQIPAKLNSYWLLLKDLDTDEKRSLIELLVKSIQSVPTSSLAASTRNRPPKPAKEEDWVRRFAGSWNDYPESAEEMIAVIEGGRTLGRQVEAL